MITVRRAEEREHRTGIGQELWSSFSPWAGRWAKRSAWSTLTELHSTPATQSPAQALPQSEADPASAGAAPDLAEAANYDASFGVLEGFGEFILASGAALGWLLPSDREVLTYVVQGALAQRDSSGRSELLSAGEFQRLSTGQNVRHHERNASELGATHVFRFVVRPLQAELALSSEQKFRSEAERQGVFSVVTALDRRRNALGIHQDVRLYSSLLLVGRHLVHTLAPDRAVWLHVLEGEVRVGDTILFAGDGMGVVDELSVSLTAQTGVELLMLDLPSPRAQLAA